MGKKKQNEKNKEDITLLAVLKSNIQSAQHYFILFKPKYYYIGVNGEENQIMFDPQ